MDFLQLPDTYLGVNLSGPFLNASTNSTFKQSSLQGILLSSNHFWIFSLGHPGVQGNFVYIFKALAGKI